MFVTQQTDLLGVTKSYRGQKHMLKTDTGECVCTPPPVDPNVLLRPICPKEHTGQETHSGAEMSNFQKSFSDL
ncbi:hypothetical protein CRENBAI_024392 [Crenichthys baileyi]|uniref:Uncharacterized protein n=1 Tax=Crenichthys baileyi TaxID=28760 RepID=A0AAV9RHU1_9TELE